MVSANPIKGRTPPENWGGGWGGGILARSGVGEWLKMKKIKTCLKGRKGVIVFPVKNLEKGGGGFYRIKSPPPLLFVEPL